jgi:predicted GH43/DUF377 family glycosyl hydrolase
MNRWSYLVAQCFLFVFLPLNLVAQVSDVDAFLGDLLSKSSIVDRRQIKIPGYPNAFNPSLIAYKDGYLLSFRFTSRCPETVKNICRTDVSFIGVARLDPNFKVIEKTIQILNMASYSSKISLYAEDARLIWMDHRIFILFNDLPPSQASGEFAMYLGELVEAQGKFVFKEPAKRLNYPRAISIEKNWTPFVSEGRLYVIYSDFPRVILEVDLNTGYCQEVTRTLINWNWNLGEIRGGTPASLVNDQFITFFHSSFPANIQKKRAYVMGAYTFDKEPPFTVRTMTPFPLGDLMDYADNSSKVVFPSGIVVQDGLIHVAWGRADKEMFITTFNRDQLLNSMEPCCE